MNYEETVDYLYSSTPVFEHTGAAAYKPGLDTAIALDNYLCNPHRSYRSIHVGGTNGKGTVCHTLAAILQEAGYRVGLFTSPHLVDFRERIRVNGMMISKSYVVEFVAKHRTFFESLKPSFFELTSAMAFAYFRSEKVDFALVEVGLGGRLDSTNIITPILSIVTSISPDHTQLLGHTLPEIACEKAGIIKPGVPVVVGNMPDEAVYEVFEQKADEANAPLYRSAGQDVPELQLSFAQSLNVQTILSALDLLDAGHLATPLPFRAIADGFAKVSEQTGLRGRWEIISRKPFIVLDVGHNEGAWRFLSAQIEAAHRSRQCRQLILLTGFSADKDVDAILDHMPRTACYIFTQASLRRALPAEALAMKARVRNLEGSVCPSVPQALRLLKQLATEDDFVFIGGSHFVVAEALTYLSENAC
jgi:dihydrofolate synthase/folylpolyglutamate synthase